MKSFVFYFLAFAFFAAIANPVNNTINYQAVLRDASGQILANKNVGLRIFVRSGSPSGTIEYSELHAANTNQFGLFNIEIGGGTPRAGTYDGIDWSDANKFIEIGVDIAGGQNYQSFGVSKLQAVPYALYSLNGVAGAKGDKGDTGEKGATGAQGAQGTKGETGATGAQGLQGPKGETGATGAQGLQGLKGDTGATGAQGLQGPKGETGATGEKGATGATGNSMSELSISFGRYVTITTASATIYGSATNFVYRGSNYYGANPTELKMVISGANTSAFNYNIRVMDITNNKVIASTSGTNLASPALQIISLPINVSNIPNNEAILEVQANISSAANKRALRIYNVLMKHN
jgi:hypothetical protein